MPRPQALRIRVRGYPFVPDPGFFSPASRVQSILEYFNFGQPPPSRAVRNRMSKIFEALKHAQLVRFGKAAPALRTAEILETTDRRRCRRVTLDFSVYVYGHDPGKDPFHEEAHTLNVSASGALLLLSVPVRKGQTLLLTNQLTQKEQDCRVIYLGARHSRTVEAGVAFPQANPDFWQLHEHPENKPAV
jgi:hypothetical protein